MRTGLQRIEENVNFLRSVPLLHNLDNTVLSKIADVLELVRMWSSTQGCSLDENFLHNLWTTSEDVNLQSCYLMFTYNLKYLEPLEAHFLFLFPFSFG